MNGQDNPIFQRSYPNAEMCNQKLKELPIWEKPLLTVVEAAKYFQIGESNIRREEFEKFLDRTNVI